MRSLTVAAFYRKPAKALPTLVSATFKCLRWQRAGRVMKRFPISIKETGTPRLFLGFLFARDVQR